jgi:non-ribosomal peptide synthase protein (TIGR01720 family)
MIAAEEREGRLRRLFAQVLGIDVIADGDDFIALGGDSIKALQLVALARDEGMVLSSHAVFQYRTVAGLAAIATPVEPARDGDRRDGMVTAPPATRWFCERVGLDRPYAHAVVLVTPPGTRLPHLERTLRQLIHSHPALRLCCLPTEGALALGVRPPSDRDGADHVIRVPVDPASDGDLRANLALRATEAAGKLTPRHGRMLEAVWFDAGAKHPGRLLLVGHYLAVDPASWRVLASDLRYAWQSGDDSRAWAHLGAGTSFMEWAEVLQREVRDPRRRRELTQWQTTLSRPVGLRLAPTDCSRDVHATAARRTVRLNGELSRFLATDAPLALHVRLPELLLAAYVLAIQDWRPAEHARADAAVLVDLEDSGRRELCPGMDLTRIVGRFASIHPLCIDVGQPLLEGSMTTACRVKAVGEAVARARRELPHGGLGFGLLRYLNDDTSRTLRAYEEPHFGFSFLGRFASSLDVPWDFADESDGIARVADPRAPLAHALDLTIVGIDAADGFRLLATWMSATAIVNAEDAATIAGIWTRLLSRLKDEIG